LKTEKDIFLITEYHVYILVCVKSADCKMVYDKSVESLAVKWSPSTKVRMYDVGVIIIILLMLHKINCCINKNILEVIVPV
jgi:hypothetical protein